jgi:hypothetical protein
MKMSNSPLTLEEIKVTGLEVFANPSDLRQDLHAFMDYARNHEIKRGHRDNRIPAAHQQRLAKLMSAPASAGQMDEAGCSHWIEHVDELCLALNFVRYDTKGIYAGYSSSEPSFPDNYMQVEEKQYKRFLNLPLQTQEEAILDYHLGDEGNEFFTRGPLTQSDPFDGWGSATGVVPTIRFAKVRRYLLELLARCQPGIWLSTASLSEHLRANDPWFLIPKEIPTAVRADGPSKGRYGNFIERKRGDWGNQTAISASDPAGFAKVEGRYLERFLEGIPLVLSYTDVAYEKRQRQSELEPSRGFVAAFRVNERLLRAMRKEIMAPTVTVLPNFEVHVESLFFSAQIDAQVRRLGELVQRGIVSVFKLTRTKVAATLAAHPDEKPIDRLASISGRPLPANVSQELTDWAGYSEKFILYQGFGVLEGRREAAEIDRFVVEAISPNLALVRTAEKLYQHLEAVEQVPIRIRHTEKTLAAPASVKSGLAPSASPRRAPSKKAVKLKRSVQTTLWFPDAEAHAAFTKILLDAKCVVPTDPRALTVCYPRKAEPQVKECLRKFNQDYSVEVTDIDQAGSS